jgi:hypothetical protein
MSVELLTRLSVSAVNFEAVRGRSYGGLTAGEFAVLLAGLDTVAVCFVLAKYCDDADSMSQLVKFVVDFVVRMAEEQDWRGGPGQADLIKLSTVAVYEVVQPHVCHVCNGHDTSCKRCNGYGIDRVSDRSVAQAIGVAQTSFIRVWKGRFHAICKYLYDIDYSIESVIYKNNHDVGIVLGSK